MSDFHVWFSEWLQDRHHFEIFKIVLDKGLLALIVALAGLLFSIILERYKSILARQEEISKLVNPGVMELRAQAQALYDAGIRTLYLLDEQFVHFHHWTDAIFDCKARYPHSDPFAPSPDFPRGPEFLDRQVDCQTFGTITIRELLDRTAPNDVVRDVLTLKDFPVAKAHYEVGGFFHDLHTNILAALAIRDENLRSVLRLGMAKSVFVPFTPQPRREYYREVNIFRFAVMRNMILLTRKHSNAMTRISEFTNAMVEFVQKYSSQDVVIIGVVEFDTYEAMMTEFAAILTQLQIALLN